MNAEEISLLKAAGIKEPTSLKKVDRDLWLAFARLKAGTPKEATNVRLLSTGKLAFTECAVAREAGSSRNTFPNNPERLRPLALAISEAEEGRRAKKRVSELAATVSRRESAEKDRLVNQQASIIAALQVELHGAHRRIAALTRSRSDPSGKGLPLSSRRTAHASGPQGRDASQETR